MKNRGVIYIATTKFAYLEAALISALALRENEPEIPITIISDQTILKLLPLDDYQISYQLVEADATENQKFFSRALKTSLNKFSPYQETLYLDADILPLQSISSLWDYLLEKDLAMVRDICPIVSQSFHTSTEEKDYTIQQIGEDGKHFNSGMMLWRNTPVINDLFSQWYREWQKFQKQDQLAFSRAIHKNRVSIVEVPKEYNVDIFDSVYFLKKKQTVYLLHCWETMVSGAYFRVTANAIYPHIVKNVDQLFDKLKHS